MTSAGRPATSLSSLRAARRKVSVAPLDRSDEELIAAVAGGDRAAFETLYTRHASAAHRMAHRVLGPHRGSEEVVQDAFLALWRTHYDPTRGSVRGFLLTIVRNRAIDALRRDSRRPVAATGEVDLAEALPSADRTDAHVERLEQAALLREMLAGLPPAQRESLELSYFGELSHTQIAQRLNQPLGTIKSRIRLALESLRLAPPAAGLHP